MPGYDNVLVAPSATDVLRVELEITSRLVDHLLSGDVVWPRFFNVGYHTFGDGDVRCDIAHLRVGKELIERTFELANVCFDVGWYDFMVRMYGVVCWCDE